MMMSMMTMMHKILSKQTTVTADIFCIWLYSKHKPVIIAYYRRLAANGEESVSRLYQVIYMLRIINSYPVARMHALSSSAGLNGGGSSTVIRNTTVQYAQGGKK